MLLSAQCHMGSKNLQVGKTLSRTQFWTVPDECCSTGAHGSLPLQDQARWHQHHQHWQDLVSWKRFSSTASSSEAGLY